MQPKSDVRFDRDSFEVLKKTMMSISTTLKHRNTDIAFSTDLPEMIGIKLTNRCNLRCKHCYQWNDEGYHNDMSTKMQSQDIDLDIVKKILVETKEVKSRIYIWGGEPLCHNEFDKIANMFEDDKRETIICTNSLLIENHLDSIIKISQNLELLIAVEGFEDEHDLLRGNGTYLKTIKAIDTLIDLKKKGIFKGKITIHSMINDRTASKLYEICRFFEDKGLDMIIICFPWYISDETSKTMDKYVVDNFSWLNDFSSDCRRSWHAFKYKMDVGMVDTLLNELRKINDRIWKLKIRFQPNLDKNDIGDFIAGTEIPGEKRSKCLALSFRMDVDPDGTVTACKFFSEFAVGNLKNSSIADIWKCEKYYKIRETIGQKLMPVCSKCSVLYLHGK